MFHYFDPLTIIKTVGLIGIILIIFAESGLAVGFFLPGDSLLFTAGFLASQHHLNLWVLLLGSALAAILGDQAGYWFGKKIGPTLFTREHSFIFNKHNIMRAHEFYTKYGKRTIILARFMPVIRTFAPIIAGVAEMEYKIFLTYNILGGVLWTIGLVTLGFWLGRVIPDVDSYLLPIIILIVVVSILPGAYHIFKGQKKRG